MRIRRKYTQTTTQEDAAGTVHTIPPMVREYFMEDKVPGGNKCFHSVSEPSAVVVRPWVCPKYPDWEFYKFTSGGTIRWPAPESIPQEILDAVPLNALERKVLPTSSDFGLIEFFAELDDTLALFTKKFFLELFSPVTYQKKTLKRSTNGSQSDPFKVKKELRLNQKSGKRELSGLAANIYGTANWGISPFIADIQAIFESIRNFRKSLSDLPYEVPFYYNFETPAAPCGTSHNYYEGFMMVKHTGTISIEGVDDILRIYDSIGFHPDLATVWNLVPLSFLVDYLFPIGDLLDSLHARGWIRAALFTGWRTIFIKYKWGPGYAGMGVNPEYYARIFQRDYFHGSILEVLKPSFDFELKEPTFRQLFDAIFIYTQVSSLGSKPSTKRSKDKRESKLGLISPAAARRLTKLSNR